jgi:hypothetical protein
VSLCATCEPCACQYLGQKRKRGCDLEQLASDLCVELAKLMAKLLQDVHTTWTSRESALKCIQRLPTYHRSNLVQLFGFSLTAMLWQFLERSEQVKATTRRGTLQVKSRLQLLLDTLGSLDADLVSVPDLLRATTILLHLAQESSFVKIRDTAASLYELWAKVAAKKTSARYVDPLFDTFGCAQNWDLHPYCMLVC